MSVAELSLRLVARYTAETVPGVVLPFNTALIPG
jgi:hypothetical protein